MGLLRKLVFETLGKSGEGIPLLPVRRTAFSPAEGSFQLFFGIKLCLRFHAGDFSDGKVFPPISEMLAEAARFSKTGKSLPPNAVQPRIWGLGSNVTVSAT